MEIQFYPYDFEYQVEDGTTYFHFFAKQEDGQKIVVKHPYRPYFYVSLEGVDTTLFTPKLNGLIVDSAAVTAWEEVEKELVGKKRHFYKIFVNYPKAVPVISNKLQSWGVDCYETDILYVHRYLRDHALLPMSLTTARGAFVEKHNVKIGLGGPSVNRPMACSLSLTAQPNFEHASIPQIISGLLANHHSLEWWNTPRFKVPLFLAEEVAQKDAAAKVDWKILAVDIETYSVRKEIDSLRNPILMIALRGKDYQKVIAWKKFNHDLDYLEIVADEAAMLERFKEIIHEQQPDILTGYFSDGFDLPYIKARADKHNVRLDLGLDHSDMVVISKTGSRSGQAAIKGILHLDVLKFIKNIFGKNLKTDSYSLDNVSRELLNHQKHEVNLDELSTVWDSRPEELGKFCAYNLHDAYLTYELCRKLLPDMIEFTTITGVPTFDVIRMSFSRLVESYIMKRSMEYGVLAPNKPGNEEISQRMDESIQGGYVYQPTPGLYQDVVVFDFRSLYPTIITAHNISPEAFRCSCCSSNTVPGKEQYWFCRREKRFISSVLENLIIKRVEVKNLIKEAKISKKKDEDTKLLEARSYALKILANSFYGYLGFYGARWYCLECAASTTAYARNYIKTTIETAQKKGFTVIYADTDSCFLLLGKKQLQDAMEFMDSINKDLPGQMELEFEGHFSRGIFVAQKGTAMGAKKGAKKKYALITNDGALKITGFESVRRNSSDLAKEVQQTVLRLILQDKISDALAYVKKIVAELKNGRVELGKLVIKTQITRELSHYASVGPHVKVARDMAARGDQVGAGTLVRYIIVKGSGLVRERARIPSDVAEGGYDADYYLKHQLIPSVSGIFAVLGYSDDEIFSKASQRGLETFF